MKDLLLVENVVRNVASRLEVFDYLNLRSTCKAIRGGALNEEFDNKIWCSRLNKIGLIKVANTSEDLESLEDPILLFKDATSLSVFELIHSYDPRHAKTIYRLIHELLEPFASKLYRRHFNNFFDTDEPEQQAVLLNNLARFVNSHIDEVAQTMEQNLIIFKELFVNSALQVMENSFKIEDYKNVGKFIHVLLICGEESNAVDFFKSKLDFTTLNTDVPADLFVPTNTSNESLVLRSDVLQEILEPLSQYLIENIKLIDILFQKWYPIACNFMESFIQEVVIKLIDSIFKTEKSTDEERSSKNTIDGLDQKLHALPQIYSCLLDLFVVKLPSSVNGGECFKEKVTEFLNIYLEHIIGNYLSHSPVLFEYDIKKQLDDYVTQLQTMEAQANEQIYNSLKNMTEVKNNDANLSNNKNDFLGTFTKIFKISEKDKEKQNKEQLHIAYNLNMIGNKLQNIKSEVNLELCYKILQQTKDLTEQMYQFYPIENLRSAVKINCQSIFKILIIQLNTRHIQPAFEKATKLLTQYDAEEMNKVHLKVEGMEEFSKVEPLVKFTELINLGDIILQMVTIYYKNELVAKKIIDQNRDFLNDVLQVKKQFETMVDDYVAEGLNIGITKLMDQISFVLNTLQVGNDYNPSPDENILLKEIKPTRSAIKVVELLSNHAFLLNGATDKGTVNVYQQEIGERFFNELVKNLKHNLISTEGAVYLICDLNYYYDFMSKKLKQKSVVALFTGLKSIGQLYLVSGKDSKELGKMISDLGKFQGVFTQEEIYEFVQRRTDWLKVRRDVEKAMYGLGVTGCNVS